VPQVPLRDRAVRASGGAASTAVSGRTGHGVRIGVLGGFDLQVGREAVTIPVSSERVLAFIALCCRNAVPRTLIAGNLWPEAPEQCAQANLRSALSRLRSPGRQALDIGSAEVRLARDTTVDLYDARKVARYLLDSATSAEASARGLTAVDALSADLLPGWYDDWALLEAEDWRQLRLHALEVLAENLIAAGRYAEAIAAAHAAVHADPLRESAQVCLIRAHLAEGNPSEALLDFARYAQRLRDDLGLDPTARLRGMVTDISPVTPP
jgi:DNA-binding SARP family transcriptional activator